MKELFSVVGGDKQEQPVPGPCGGSCLVRWEEQHGGRSGWSRASGEGRGM